MRDAARKYVAQPIATEAELETFLSDYPGVDPRTGLHLVDDELLIKSREAMLFAVQAFNNPTNYFKTEIFIVTSIIAWTYLAHHYFRKSGVDYIYRKGGQTVQTANGQPKHFDLRKCLAIPQCPFEAGEKRNLDYLIGLRDEIEHRSTSRIYDAISAKLQACCLNFNTAIKRLFGARCGLDRDLALALQFARVDGAQRKATSAHSDLPPAIEAYNAAFEEQLSNEELNDPTYAYRVALVPITISNRRKADEVFEIIDRGTDEAERINLLLRDRERPKQLPTAVVKQMQDEGFPKFRMHEHTQLWKTLDGKNPGKGYGIAIAKTWYWYDRWIEVVRQHCENKGDLYR